MREKDEGEGEGEGEMFSVLLFVLLLPWAETEGIGWSVGLCFFGPGGSLVTYNRRRSP